MIPGSSTSSKAISKWPSFETPKTEGRLALGNSERPKSLKYDGLNPSRMVKSASAIRKPRVTMSRTFCSDRVRSATSHSRRLGVPVQFRGASFLDVSAGLGSVLFGANAGNLFFDGA